VVSGLLDALKASAGVESFCTRIYSDSREEIKRLAQHRTDSQYFPTSAIESQPKESGHQIECKQHLCGFH
jgi:hypothetical protein